jgi:DNA replication protein DnaC
MKEKIEETLKRLAAGTLKASSPTHSTSEGSFDRLGDPDCPECHGLGYLRRDLPVNDPEFGRLEICTCRRADVQARIRQRLFSLSHLDDMVDMTFETFSSRGRTGYGQQQQESIERALNQARHYAGTLEGWLLIQGPYGCGKSHLAAAISNAVVALGVPTLFLTVPDLLDTLRFAFDAEDVTFEERFESIRRSPLLVLDDFGTQSATQWSREKLFQILNYRYINKMPLVVTTNLALEELDGRMRSRLSDPDLVSHINIQAPDYRRPIEDSGQNELSSLALHGDQTLGNFNLRRGEKLTPDDQRTLEEAYQAAKAFAEKPDGWLVLLGSYGSGKTHLAAAIAKWRADQGFAVMFVGVSDLLDHLRATFNPSSHTSYDRRFESVRTAPLLVLDDLGTQAATPWVQEKLYQLFNHRYIAKLPTVITSASTLEEIDPRLRSRMLDRRLCQIKPITAPAYRGGRSKPRR